MFYTCYLTLLAFARLIQFLFILLFCNLLFFSLLLYYNTLIVIVTHLYSAHLQSHQIGYQENGDV